MDLRQVEENVGFFFLPYASQMKNHSVFNKLILEPNDTWVTEFSALLVWTIPFLIFIVCLAKAALSSCPLWHYSKTKLETAGWGPCDLHSPGHPSETIPIESWGGTFSCFLSHSIDGQTLETISPSKSSDLRIQGVWGDNEKNPQSP